MTMTKLMIAGRERSISEPVFRKLRIILKAYDRLFELDCTEIDKVNDVEIILACLLDDLVKIRHLKDGELNALLNAMSDICGLKKTVSPDGKRADTDWGYIYAHLSACMGWTYDYIDNSMTLSRLEEYRHYMEKHPPTHQLVAAYLGYEHQEKQEGNSFFAAIAAQVKNKQGLSS